jgi:hypothetical protein
MCYPSRSEKRFRVKSFGLGDALSGVVKFFLIRRLQDKRAYLPRINEIKIVVLRNK